MKIGILGMGGVGSFLGAKLAGNYEKNGPVKIIFICRGATKESININGLALQADGKVLISEPYLATENPEEIGILDVLIIATKAFSLAGAVKQYQTCLSSETVVIPLQNGINAKEVILNNIADPRPKILEGCIYVAANIEKPGRAIHRGGPGKIFFGNDHTTDFLWVEETLQKGGIDATYTKSIKDKIWRKFLFVSPLSLITTAFGITFGQLADNTEHIDQFIQMMREVQKVAKVFNVILTDEDIESSLKLLDTFPYNAKSSLQLDFEYGNNITEKPYLVDYIIQKGEEYGIDVGTYRKISEKLHLINPQV